MEKIYKIKLEEGFSICVLIVHVESDSQRKTATRKIIFEACVPTHTSAES